MSDHVPAERTDHACPRCMAVLARAEPLKIAGLSDKYRESSVREGQPS